MNVELTATEPAEIEADVLALAAEGLLVRQLDARFEGRLTRAAAEADPVTVVQVGHELRARRVLLVALDELDPDGAADGRGPGGTCARRGRHDRLGARRFAAVRPIPPGAGGGRGRGPRRLPRGPLEERLTAAGHRALHRVRRERRAARGRGARRAHGALDERRPRAGRRPAEPHHARAPRRARSRASRRARRRPRSAGGRPPGARRGGRVERGDGAAADRHPPRASGRSGAAAPGARGEGRDLRRGRVLPQAAVRHRPPEGRHGRRRGGARRARRDRRARAAARRHRDPPGLREHDRRRCRPALGRHPDGGRPHRRGHQPGRRGAPDPRRRALVRARARGRRTSSTSRR